MKTFEEHMQESVGATYPIEDILNNLLIEDIVEEVNIYAKEVAREALNNASENVNVKVVGMGYIVIDKQSILSESNIPEL